MLVDSSTGEPQTIKLIGNEHRLTVIEQRQDAFATLLQEQNAGYARVEIILAVFAVLLTILVIYLGLRVEKSAVKSAADQAKDQLTASKGEVEQCVAEARTVSNEAKRLLTEIEGHKLVAASDVAEIRNIKAQATTSNPKRRPIR